MPNRSLLFLLLGLLCHGAFAQKTFDITIRLADGMDAHKVKCQYYNGTGITFVRDTFVDNTLHLKGEYCSQLVSLVIEYAPDAESYYQSRIFIEDKPARIDFYYRPNKDNELPYSSIVNARPTFDTTTNESYRELLNARKKDFMVIADIVKKSGNNVFGNDSTKHAFLEGLKVMNAHAMLILSKYPDDYFSFWYFRDQIARGALDYFDKDTAYLESLLDYCLSVFPGKFMENAEGTSLVKDFNVFFDPPAQVGQMAPDLSLKDIHGRQMALADYRGKYVLLDFWATWCRPCMEEIPFVRDIRSKYPIGKLTIIGISQDEDSLRMATVIRQDEMNWIHVLDRKRLISKYYGVRMFPTLVLVDGQGRVVYNSYNEDDAKTMLPKLLN